MNGPLYHINQIVKYSNKHFWPKIFTGKITDVYVPEKHPTWIYYTIMPLNGDKDGRGMWSEDDVQYQTDEAHLPLNIQDLTQHTRV